MRSGLRPADLSVMAAKAEAKRQEAIARSNADKEKIARNAAEDQTKIAYERLKAAQSALAGELFAHH